VRAACNRKDDYELGYAHGIRFADENLTGKDMRAEGSAAAPAEPPGWKLVPIEPTREMLAGAVKATFLQDNPYLEMKRRWRGFLEAAPAYALAQPVSPACRECSQPRNLHRHWCDFAYERGEPKEAQPVSPAPPVAWRYRLGPTGDWHLVTAEPQGAKSLADIQPLYVGPVSPAPEPLTVTPSEALYAFAGWLTTRPGSLVAGETHGAAEWADAVERFRLAQGWPEPRPNYADRIKRYSHAASQPVAAPAEPDGLPGHSTERSGKRPEAADGD
jgi:hypothetical protein